MSKINSDRLIEFKQFYYGDKLCMREIADKMGISIDAVVYFMRKNGLKRRNFSEVNELRFKNKPLSFKINQDNNSYLKDLRAIGAMLYWGEGYKSDKSKGIDFANSDPEMISIFLNFLRRIYSVDEKRLRILIYSYSNQDTGELITFWSKITHVPPEQFSKPYIRQDFNSDNHRKMKWGLIHVRYSDKKLFIEIKKLINSYKIKYDSMPG